VLKETDASWKYCWIYIYIYIGVFRDLSLSDTQLE